MTAPLIVAGMHRSGTSLTASFIDSLGISMGTALLPPDINNAPGYFEDVDFLEFHRRLLRAATRPDELGVHDWGWTTGESLDSDVLHSFTEEAQGLIRSRSQNDAPWGWKDPRTTVVLDFWNTLVPDARYLLVYRPPWDVAVSMLRVGGDFFTRYPDLVLEIWSFYNERLLQFYRAHRDRCILLHINSLIRAPEQIIELMHDRLGVESGPSAGSDGFAGVFQGELFHALPPAHPALTFLHFLSPRSFQVYRQLEQESDAPENRTWEFEPAAEPPRLTAAPLRWCNSDVKSAGELARRERELAAAQEQLARTQEQLARTQEQLRATEERLQQSEHETRSAQAEIVSLMQAREADRLRLEGVQSELAAASQELEGVRQVVGETEGRLEQTQSDLAKALEERTILFAALDQIQSTKAWRLRSAIRRILRLPV